MSLQQNIGHAHRVGRRQLAAIKEKASGAVEGHPVGTFAQASLMQDLPAPKSSSQDSSTDRTGGTGVVNVGLPPGAHPTAPPSTASSAELLDKEDSMAGLAGSDPSHEDERLSTHGATADSQIPATPLQKWTAINSPKNRRARTLPTRRTAKTSPTGVSKRKSKSLTSQFLTRTLHKHYRVLEDQIGPSMQAETGHDGKSMSIRSGENNLEEELSPARSRQRRRSVIGPSEEELPSGATRDQEKASLYLPPVDIQPVSSTPADWSLDDFANLSLTFDAGGSPSDKPEA